MHVAVAPRLVEIDFAEWSIIFNFGSPATGKPHVYHARTVEERAGLVAVAAVAAGALDLLFRLSSTSKLFFAKAKTRFSTVPV